MSRGTTPPVRRAGLGDRARRAERHQLPLYFVLAFLLSWAAWPLVALNPDSRPLVPFGPLLAAITVCAATGGLRRVGRPPAQLTRWRASPYWYLIAPVGPVALTGAAAGLAVAAGGVVPGDRGPRDAGMIGAAFPPRLSSCCRSSPIRVTSWSGGWLTGLWVVAAALVGAFA
jgi:hypothetical protein